MSNKKRGPVALDAKKSSTSAILKKRKSNVELIPRNTAQEEYVEYLLNRDKRIVLAVGPAGTGKTMLAVMRAIIALRNGEVSKIVISRPAVGVEGEDHGFLPGTLNQKMEPWLMPILDIFNEYWTPKEIEDMVNDKVIEFSPLMYMRGRTFKNSYLILDEAQNTTPDQMKMFLTRMGYNSEAAITGDLKQNDQRKINGLQDFTDRLLKHYSPKIALIEFKKEHIERDTIVVDVLDVYGEE